MYVESLYYSSSKNEREAPAQYAEPRIQNVGFFVERAKVSDITRKFGDKDLFCIHYDSQYQPKTTLGDQGGLRPNSVWFYFSEDLSPDFKRRYSGGDNNNIRMSDIWQQDDYVVCSGLVKQGFLISVDDFRKRGNELKLYDTVLFLPERVR